MSTESNRLEQPKIKPTARETTGDPLDIDQLSGIEIGNHASDPISSRFRARCPYLHLFHMVYRPYGSYEVAEIAAAHVKAAHGIPEHRLLAAP